MSNNETLKQLYRVVEAAPDDKFHMRAVVENAICGTARCALGWALVDPWFIENTDLGQWKDWTSNRFPLTTYEIGRIFNISDDDANILFAGDVGTQIDEHAISKEEVLDNIQALLLGEAPEEYEAVKEYNKDEEDDDMMEDC